VGGLCLFYPVPRALVRMSGVVALMSGVGLLVFGLSVFGRPGFRHFLPAGVLAAVLCGVGLNSLTILLERILAHWDALKTANRAHTLAIVMVLGMMFAGGLWNQAVVSWQDARERSLPDTRNALTAWIDVSVAP